MSTPPPPPSEKPSDRSAPQPAEQAPEPARRRRPDPRRNLAGVGFLLLGGYFAYGVWQIQTSVWLKALLLVVFAGVAVYGAVQLVQNRRR